MNKRKTAKKIRPLKRASTAAKGRRRKVSATAKGRHRLAAGKSKKRPSAAADRRLETARNLASAYARLLASGRDCHPENSRLAELERQERRLLDELGQVCRQLAQERHYQSTPVERSRQRQGLVQELVNLLAHPDIAAVEISGRTFVVITRGLTLKYGTGAYDLGRIRMEFRLINEGENGRASVQFFSLDRKGPTAHPHVSGGGYPCLGNISQSLIQLIGQGQLATAAFVSLDFLRSYTQDDDHLPYTSISYWPLKR